MKDKVNSMNRHNVSRIEISLLYVYVRHGGVEHSNFVRDWMMPNASAGQQPPVPLHGHPYSTG